VVHIVRLETDPTKFMLAFLTVHVVATFRFLNRRLATRTFSMLKQEILYLASRIGMLQRCLQRYVALRPFMGCLEANFTEIHLAFQTMQLSIISAKHLPAIRPTTKSVIGVQLLLIFIQEILIPLVFILRQKSLDMPHIQVLRTIILRTVYGKCPRRDTLTHVTSQTFLTECMTAVLFAEV
jgi:hypothetical protein